MTLLRATLTAAILGMVGCHSTPKLNGNYSCVEGVCQQVGAYVLYRSEASGTMHEIAECGLAGKPCTDAKGLVRIPDTSMLDLINSDGICNDMDAK